jgi:hypothetical protein
LKRSLIAVVVPMALLLPGQPALSQEAKTKETSQRPEPGQGAPVPPAEKLVLLVRLSLLTLNDALQTGNYTVLRDRAGPSFSRNNTAAQLGRIFAKLEAQKLDLAAVATLTPTLTAAEVAGRQPLLHVAGYFPGRSTQIDFDLMFEPADGHWRMFGISVAEVPSAGVTGKAAPQAPGSAAPPKKK